MRAFMHAYNIYHRLRRSPSRYFIYRHREVRRLLAASGYVEFHDGGSRYWRVAAFRH
jgi:hypothetical protein